jgi:di/tricarboxylate transporter
MLNYRDKSMTFGQTEIFLIIAGALFLFVWGRWRYDLVAVLVLLATVLTGLVPAKEAFVGFSHPAVVTVAAILVISKALQNSGLIGWIARFLAESDLSPSLQVGAIAAMVAVLSGFMNNVGALALLMPVVLQITKKSDRHPGELLMPLSFGSLLGGLTTLIGTPPNIIIANIRAQYADGPFTMFDFTPVGVAIAVLGLILITAGGWKLIPVRSEGGHANALFDIEDYITEVKIAPKTKFIGVTVAEARAAGLGENAVIVDIIRRGKHRLAPTRNEVLRSGDHLMIEADAAEIEDILKNTDLELVGSRSLQADVLRSESIGVMQAVVAPNSALVRRTPTQMRLGPRYHLNLLAVSRQGKAMRNRMNQARLRAGDVLLLQGDLEAIPATLSELGCLPLPHRGLAIGKTPGLAPLLIFAAAVIAAVAGLVSVPVAFLTAVAALIITRQISLRDTYDAIDWPVIVLLGAMVPVGAALESSGGSALIAGWIAEMRGLVPDWGLVTMILIAAMFLSDIMNNAATAVLMGNLAGGLAAQLGVSPDPFLMAVALGSSCAFLTPIGHQSNLLVMGPGGYHFGDYWRLGLPLEAAIVVAGVPAILLIWPL